MKVMELQRAVLNHPSTKSYTLDEITVLDLINMSEVAEFDISLKFTPQGSIQQHAWTES